ncbi:MAG TPA: RHS repeat-associated core domain-containing protein, partial [Gemmataceae bacterium]|nr:RHS repeat-associated core domain-containing protein [Gemmataceae bacterium]
YSYNADNEMTSLGLSINSTLDAQLTFSYDGDGNVTGMTSTAPSVSGSHTITTSYSYNQVNELTNITDMDATANTLLASYSYSYNADGNVSSYQDNSGNSLTYGYNGDQELTSATGTLAGSNYTFTYNYDPNGNRTSTSTDVNGNLTSATYTTGTGNELLSDGTYSYTYDHDGNMTSQTNLQTGSVTYYTWNYENQLTEVKVENSQGQVLEDETFTYDVFGNRIAESLNGTPTLYTVYNGSNPYMDFNGSGTLTERYLTNPNTLSQFYGQVSASGTVQWFLTDNINSIRQVISASGSVLNAITYDPYGNILNQTNAAYAPRMLYAGGTYDPLAGNYQFDARNYSPADGRFVSQDPLGFKAGDTDLYRYVGNRPTNLVDPSGMMKIGWSWWGALGGALSTGTFGMVIGGAVTSEAPPLVPVGMAIGAGVGAFAGCVAGGITSGTFLPPDATPLEKALFGAATAPGAVVAAGGVIIITGIIILSPFK